jgi:hypothetical protein
MVTVEIVDPEVGVVVDPHENEGGGPREVCAPSRM